MSFKDNEAIQEAKAIEEDARADVKEARNHLNSCQTRLASEGKDPEPKKVGKKNPI